jgi:hypothetical protein
VPQPPLQQDVQRTEAQRAESHPLEPLASQRALEPQHVGGPERRAHRREHTDGMTVESARGERERPRGRGVQPLHVVDRDDDRRRPRDLDEQRAQGHGHGLRLRPAPRAAGLPQQCDLQRLTLGRGQSEQALAGRVPDQVG